MTRIYSTIVSKEPTSKMKIALLTETDRLLRSDIHTLQHQIIRLKNQLTTLTWAAHIPLSLPAGEAMTACDLGVLRSEVDSAENMLGGAK